MQAEAIGGMSSSTAAAVAAAAAAPMVRRMRRFVPHAGLKHAAAGGDLSPAVVVPDLSPVHAGAGMTVGIQELNKRLTDMKMASNPADTALRRESTFSNYWSMKSDYSRRSSQVSTWMLIDVEWWR